MSAESDTSNTDDEPHTTADATGEGGLSAWREIYEYLGVDPDATHPPADPTTVAAVLDEDRPRRNRRKHAGGRSS